MLVLSSDNKHWINNEKIRQEPNNQESTIPVSPHSPSSFIETPPSRTTTTTTSSSFSYIKKNPPPQTNQLEIQFRNNVTEEKDSKNQSPKSKNTDESSRRKFFAKLKGTSQSLQNLLGNQASSSSQTLSFINKNNIEDKKIGTTSLLESQGLEASSDKSRVIYHESTVPLNEYEVKNLSFMNMDRGTTGQRNGKNYGIVCDGSGSGKDVVIVTQAFTKSIEKSIQEKPFNQRNDLKGLAKTIFETASKSVTDNDYYGIAATAVFATFTDIPGSNQLRVEGATIGDAVAISLNRTNGIACQLNEINRKDPQDQEDSGGAIAIGAMTEDDFSRISTFSEEISRNDVVILASDGLLDNIYQGDTTDLKNLSPDEKKKKMKQWLELVIPQIVFNPKFDAPLNSKIEKKLWIEKTPPRLPNPQDLQEFGESLKFSKNIDNLMIATRLMNYLKFITFEQTQLVSQANENLIQLEKLQTSQNQTKNEEMKQTEIQNINQALDILWNQKTDPKNVAKTDDCLIIVMSPTGN